MQGIFQKENTDKALKYGIYRHLPTYEKIIRNLVSFSVKKCQKREKRGDLLTLIPFSCTVISTGVSYLALYHNKHARFAGT